MESLTEILRSSAILWMGIGSSDRGEDDVDACPLGGEREPEALVDERGGVTWMTRA